jgi:excisionase family DNA binding protein
VIASALTTAQAAEKLGITERGVRNLIESGTLPARKLGKQWFIDPADLKRSEVKDRKPGRPTAG